MKFGTKLPKRYMSEAGFESVIICFQCQPAISKSNGKYLCLIVLPFHSSEARRIDKHKLLKKYYQVRFQVLTATSTKMTVFWDVVQCSLVETYRRFGNAYSSITLKIEAVSTSETSVNFYKTTFIFMNDITLIKSCLGSVVITTALLVLPFILYNN
jgi:hypothetical protein